MIQRRTLGSGSAASRFGDCAVVALLLGCGLAFPAEPAARFQVDQPARSMAESLRDIARQTHTFVMFDPTKVNGRSSKAVHGQLTAAEALTLAVEGSGLEVVAMPDGSVAIRAAASAMPGAASAPQGAGSGAATGSADQSSSAEGTDPAARGARLAVATDPSGDESSGRGETPDTLGKVVVTGSRLRRVANEGATPVNVYTHKDIERSGQPTLERFLGTLNEASVSSGEGAVGATVGQGTVQLRGLPLGSTLVLINGRRLQAVGSSSGNYFNLNLIPMAAVDRVEIVPVGSSAVYGGDALAGVVNIVLKKSIDGLLLDARLASASGTRDGGISFGAGRQGDAGSFLLLGSYSKSTPLTMTERAFFRDGDYRRFGGIDARTRSCTPGTVTSTTSANLPGLNSTFAGIPASAVGQALTPADFSATAGQANLCNPLANGNGSTLLFGSESFALHATGERHLNEKWDVFGELSFDRDRTGADQAGYQLNNVVVPATNPYNPFGTAVRVTERLGLQNGSETFARSTDFKRMLLGLRGELGSGWDTEVTFSTTRDDGVRHQIGSGISAKLNAALASTNPATALNPFTSGLAASDNVLNSIWVDSPRYNHGRKDQASAYVRGSLLTLPSGSVDVIAGAEMTHDHYQSVTPGTFDIEASRSSDAVYGELRVPLWRDHGDGPDGAFGPSREMAALTLAGRRDHYDDFGSANTYQAGLEFRPLRTLLLRGSAATSFKPPTLLQTHVDEQTFTSETAGLVDPARGGAPVIGGEVLRISNPNLHPENGRAYSLGAVWEPASDLGTRLAATAWQVRIRGLIALLWPQVPIDNEALFPGLVTRGPSTGGVPGPITSVLYTEVNFGSVTTSGADMELSHAWRTSLGKWTAGVSATRTTRYDVAITPDAPVDNRLGHRTADYWSPKWKGRVSLGFDRGAWSVALTSRYLGGYQDSGTNGRSLGSYWLQDLAASFNLTKMGVILPAAKESVLSVGIANVTNRLPEYVSTYPYYDVTQADWRGRYASARLSVTW